MISTFRIKPGEVIEVFAQGMRYRGVLVEMTSEEILLKGSTKTWSISLNQVQRLTRVEPSRSALGSHSKPHTQPIVDPAGFSSETDPEGHR